jgi:hypothetical protein
VYLQNIGSVRGAVVRRVLVQSFDEGQPILHHRPVELEVVHEIPLVEQVPTEGLERAALGCLLELPNIPVPFVHPF